MLAVPGADEEPGLPGPLPVDAAGRPVQAALRPGQVAVRAGLARRPHHGFPVGGPRRIPVGADVMVLGQQDVERAAPGDPPVPEHRGRGHGAGGSRARRRVRCRNTAAARSACGPETASSAAADGGTDTGGGTISAAVGGGTAMS